APENVDELGHGPDARVARDRVQPRQREVLLAGLEHDRRALVHQAAEVGEVVGRELGGRGHDHDVAPASTRTGSRPTATRRKISPRRPSSGTTASARPARATNPGMPQTTLD